MSPLSVSGQAVVCGCGYYRRGRWGGQFEFRRSCCCPVCIHKCAICWSDTTRRGGPELIHLERGNWGSSTGHKWETLLSTNVIDLSPRVVWHTWMINWMTRVVLWLLCYCDWRLNKGICITCCCGAPSTRMTWWHVTTISSRGTELSIVTDHCLWLEMMSTWLITFQSFMFYG